eukprot:2102514-Rhodomonas_salina.4
MPAALSTPSLLCRHASSADFPATTRQRVSRARSSRRESEGSKRDRQQVKAAIRASCRDMDGTEFQDDVGAVERMQGLLSREAKACTPQSEPQPESFESGARALSTHPLMIQTRCMHRQVTVRNRKGQGRERTVQHLRIALDTICRKDLQHHPPDIRDLSSGPELDTSTQTVVSQAGTSPLPLPRTPDL